MKLRLPLRDPNERLDAKSIGSLPRVLEGEDRALCRELLIRSHAVGMRTIGDVHELLKELEPTERKALLNKIRRHLGLKSEEPKVKRVPSTWSEWQSCPACGAIPVNQFTGAPESVDVVRWWCPSHRGMAGPGDLARKTSGLRYSPSGAIVEDNPAELEREQREAEMRRRRHEEQLRVRKLEAERMAREQELRDAAFRAELPEAFR